MRLAFHSPLLKRTLINLFIVLHLVIILAWALPLDSQTRGAINDRARSYLLFTGLWQGWDMFAPNPVTINAYLEAEVDFADGSRVTWDFPRMQHLPKLQAYFKERYRKWAVDHLRLDANRRLWPDAARYIARLHLDRPARPVEIRLIRRWAQIPPPELAEVPDDWRSHTFYVHRVIESDLVIAQ